jgi:HEAT repeat protein
MNREKISHSRASVKSGHWISRMVNLRSGEGKPVLLLILFSFFMGMALSYYFTASNAIFIKHFEPRMISLSYMVSGVAVYLTWLLLTLIDRRLSVVSRIIVKYMLILVSVVAISIGTWLHDTGLMAFILFTFVRVLVYISLVTFWGLAGKLFNLRQGKRIFGLIGTGEAISIILGYFSIPVMLHFVKTPFLLFFSSFAFLLCFLIMLIIVRVFREQLEYKQVPSVAPLKEDTKQWKYTSLIRKPYFLLISLLALLPIFGYLYVDYMFLHQLKFEFHNDRETIARFFGYILGFVAVVELIFKLFVSGRLLNKYGLKPSLLSLPFVLLISTMMAALFGAIYGPAGIFFTFIVFSRLLERSVRVAIYEPAFQLLYQPVPSEQRLAFQSQIEGIPKALGTILTGAILWVFASIHFMNLVHYNIFFLAVIGVWIYFAFRMFKSYRSRIRELLSEEKSAVSDRILLHTSSCISDITDFILGQKTAHFRKFFRLIEKIDPLEADPAINNLLIKSTESLRTEIIQFIEQKQVVSARKTLTAMHLSSGDKNLPPAVENALSELSLAESYPVDLLSNLAHSKDPEEREVAARLLAGSPQYRTIRILSELLHDPSPSVRIAALVAAGKTKRVELWQGIIENLNHPDYLSTAFAALRNIGEPVVDRLEELFKRTGTNRATQILIIKLYHSIGGTRAIRHLRSRINFPDFEIRMQVMLALSKLNYKANHPEQIMIRQTIESNVETMVWIMAGIQDLEPEIRARHLLEALQAELAEKKEHIFLLLSLIYDAQTIRLIRTHIESGNSQSKAFALEISDMIVSAEIKEILLPLFDDITVQERLALFRYRFPQERLSCLERIFDIINKDYNAIRNWTKTCAIELLIHFDTEEAIEILCANIVNPSPMISETAAWILHALDQERFYDVLSVQHPRDKQRLENVTKKIGMAITFREKLLITEKTEALKNSGLFTGVPDPVLAETAMSALDMTLAKNQSVPDPEQNISHICLVLSGQIDKLRNKRRSDMYRDTVFMMENNGSSDEDLAYRASEDSLLLAINMDRVIDLMREYPGFTRRFLEWYSSLV